MIAATRLRGGNASSARGAASLAAEAVRAARCSGCTGTIVVRADSAFYGAPVVWAIQDAGAFVSLTVRVDPKVKVAIAAIGEDTWILIKYPRAIWDDPLVCWMSDAQVAEVTYTAFTRYGSQPITARLIVRRAIDPNLQAADGLDAIPLT